MRWISAMVSRGDPGPWFRNHPRSAFGVAAGLFAAVFALRMAVDGTQESISSLYVLPIALLAISFGFRVGVAAGVTAIGFLMIWSAASSETLDPLGWLSRATPLLLLGALVGFAADKLREAERIGQQAAAVALLQREAAEIHDDIVQGLAVTKWTFEAGDTERGLVMLEQNLESAQHLVTRMLGTGSVLPGDLRRSVPIDGFTDRSAATASRDRGARAPATSGDGTGGDGSF